MNPEPKHAEIAGLLASGCVFLGFAMFAILVGVVTLKVAMVIIGL